MIGLIDIDGKLPNLALMKISSYYKSMGEQVEFVQQGKQYEKVYGSSLFSWNRHECEKMLELYPDAQIGGTGWDLHIQLSPEIERMNPDYDLYTADAIYRKICRGIGKKESKMKKAQEIVDAGIGFTSRGCVRNCGFCVVPKKEGCFRQESEISELLNPRSNVLILHDNNLTADPLCIDKLHEIRDRGIVVDINQGCDVRLMTDDIAKAMSEVKHLRSLHYAWDLMGVESKVMEGINTLSKHIKPYRHMCFMLVGYDTSFEEDMYRFRRLKELQVNPYVMIYNHEGDGRLKHFARWVNGRIYKACSWTEYLPWINEQGTFNQISMFEEGAKHN